MIFIISQLSLFTTTQWQMIHMQIQKLQIPSIFCHPFFHRLLYMYIYTYALNRILSYHNPPISATKILEIVFDIYNFSRKITKAFFIPEGFHNSSTVSIRLVIYISLYTRYSKLGAMKLFCSDVKHFVPNRDKMLVGVSVAIHPIFTRL